MTKRKSAAAKKSGGKKTTAAPRGKRLSVTLDADTMALLEESLAQRGYSKEAFVNKAIRVRISRDKISEMIEDMIR